MFIAAEGLTLEESSSSAERTMVAFRGPASDSIEDKRHDVVNGTIVSTKRLKKSRSRFVRV